MKDDGSIGETNIERCGRADEGSCGNVKMIYG